MPDPRTDRPPVAARARQDDGASKPATSEAGRNAFSAEAPKVELPKGGGALRSIGEKFTANAVTGTGSMTVPIAVSPGRGGFGPQLALSYDSGSGNGPFGLGWGLSLPQITRKTDKGLPRYLDAQEPDVFLLSGAEDLVPTRDFVPPRTVGEQTYQVCRYRPRIEGLFARIECWTNTVDPRDVRWRSISKDNITTWYGKTPRTRICDPADPSRIFAWLIDESHDDKGNVIAYEYVGEDDAGVNPSDLGEHGRQAAANQYIKRIRYGNRSSRLVTPDLKDGDWLFEVVFDYDEDHVRELSDSPKGHARVSAARDSIDPDRVWPVRADSFSHHRAGFEIRTRRLCRRVLMFHLFDEAGLEQPPPMPNAEHPRGCLVKATEFGYTQEDHSGLSLLCSVTLSGFRWRADEAAYWKKSLPTLEFEYSQATLSNRVCELDAASLENLPQGLDGTQFQWVDLDGEGLSGVLARHAQCWYYKPNLGAQDCSAGADEPTFAAAFGLVQAVRTIPATASGSAQLLDLAGDGQLSLTDFSSPLPGFYKRGTEDDWAPFVPFRALPNVDWNDPNLRFVDLTGDGHADVLVTEDAVFTWYPSQAEDGFGPGERVYQGVNEDAGARLVFADGTQGLYLADLSGDGLTDLVRIRNGEICYWPNRGYGRFGAKVTMRDSPWFDTPDIFDQRRIRLADIDGSGCTDILYLAAAGPRLYFNQSGNGWSAAIGLAGFPPIDDVAAVNVVDLFGTGTLCLVWSSALAANAGRPLRYVDLMGGLKPHLLTRSVNNLGAETKIHYLPSTHFYLRDKLAGHPWITRLPFPVQVVSSVETVDHISRNRFSTRYAYHHGYYDGVEREFRGFGMVEQWDTEQFAALSGSAELPAPQAQPAWDNLQPESQVPPVYTKTWFHTGAYLGREHISDFFAGRLAQHDIGTYYREPGLNDTQANSLLLADTELPEGLSIDEAREACRALKGAMLRQEVYAQDGTAYEPHPYAVTEQNFTIEWLQPRGSNRHAVFFTHAREAISYHYERHRDCAPGTADPRVAHTMTLEVDAYGNVTKAASIAYGRRANEADPRLQPQDRIKQRLNHITYTDASFTKPAHGDDVHRNPLPAQSSTYELRLAVQDIGALGLTLLYAFDDLRRWTAQASDGRHDVHYEDLDFEAARHAVQDDPAEATHYFRRPIEVLRTLYRPDDCGVKAGDANALLALGELEPLALPGESYKLALTARLVSRVFRRRNPDAGSATEPLLDSWETVLCDRGPDGGGYVNLDGNGCWWIPSGRVFFSPQPADDASTELAWAREHFFNAARYRDAFMQSTCVRFDAHDLFTQEATDALGNCTRVLVYDYRVLQPRLVMDPNRNRAEVAFDTLGMVVGSAVMGKPEQSLGDLLDGFDPDLGDVEVLAHLADPHAGAKSILGRATTRLVYDLFAYQRSQALPSPQPAVVYTLARETHDSDLQPGAEPKFQHSFSYSDGFGREIQQKRQAEPLSAAQGGTGIDPRWVASGWAIFNNKGQPVRQYEPFFTDTHRFEFGVKQGVSAVLFYDPVGRAIATLHPNHTYEKVVFGPWRQVSFDANDTTLGSTAPGAPAFDPKNDPDVGHFFKRLADGEYLPTWHALRTDPAHAALAAQQWPDPRTRDAERCAAVKAAAHADTPATAFFDTLGRAFVALAHNRVVCQDHSLNGTESHDATRSDLDIEGNVRAVRDAIVQADDMLGRIVMRYDYDMLGNRIHQASMEAGERWTLSDVTGKPIRAWDSRGHTFTTTYDTLRRPIEQRVRGTTTESDPRTLNCDTLIDKIEYGEAQAHAEALNLRTRVYRHFDSAGVLTNADQNPNTPQPEAYDFKGNLLRSTRQLASDYKAIPDWSLNPALDDEVFSSATRYDALNRPIQSIAPHSNLARAKRNVVQPVFNEAGLLDRVSVWLDWAAEPVGLLDASVDAPSPVGVTNIDYDAKGQRQRIDYLNGASSFHDYDPQTFRLVHLLTKRSVGEFPGDCPQPPPEGWPGCQVQNLRYSYDPVGNITHIQDDAQQTIYFRNQRVEPSNDYTYDALYRLIEATGREHLGQGGAPIPHSYNDAGRAGILCADAYGHFSPNDQQAMGRYTERYDYDAAGNFMAMRHLRNDGLPSWTRSYIYDDASLIEGGALRKTSNRLTNTSLGGVNGLVEPYRHDAHGNMLCMPQLQLMQWDFRDRLRTTQRQRVNDEDVDGRDHEGDRTYYVYDASGERVRKVTELVGGNVVTERIYLGGFEVFRRHGGAVGANTARLERETLHVMDDKQRIALVETRTLDTAGDDLAPRRLIRYQFGNHLGSACVELDQQAQVISYEEYSPYSSTTYQAVRSRIEMPKRYRSTGMERDEEGGLSYHGARYCAAWLGRWVCCDPAGLLGGSNLYAYAHDRPVGLVDLSGLAPRETEAQRIGRTAQKLGAENEVLWKVFQDLANELRALHGYLKVTVKRGIPPVAGSAKEMDAVIKKIKFVIEHKAVGVLSERNATQAQRLAHLREAFEQVGGYVSESGSRAGTVVQTWYGKVSSAELATLKAEAQTLGQRVAVTSIGTLRQRIATLKERVAAAGEKGSASTSFALGLGLTGLAAVGTSSLLDSESAGDMVGGLVSTAVEWAQSLGGLGAASAAAVAYAGAVKAGGMRFLLHSAAQTAEAGGEMMAGLESAGLRLAGSAASALPLGLVTALAATSVTWAVVDTRRALAGKKTLTDEAIKTYQTYGFRILSLEWRFAADAFK